jgi:hypothetical protein
VLGLGIVAALRLPMSPQRRLIVCLMWAGYLIRGLTWHSQLINSVGILVVGLIFCYPRLAAREAREGEPSLKPSSVEGQGGVSLPENHASY